MQPHIKIIPAKQLVATFKLLTSDQTEYRVPLEPALLQSKTLWSNLQNLVEIKNKTNASKPQRPEYFWFPTPETHRH